MAFPVALAVRLTVRDEYPWTGLIFFATPWPALWAMAFACTWRWRKTRMVFWLGGITLACLGMWMWTSLKFGPKERPPGSFRISYWNVARPEKRLPRVLAEADEWHADVLVFGEHRHSVTRPEWAGHFAPRAVTPLEWELLLVSEAPVKKVGGGSLAGRGGWQLCRVQVQGRDVNILMVDFDSHPAKSREPAFKRLREIVAMYADRPLIVLGDFNTPADSVHFADLRRLVTPAFDRAGRGYAATWPMPAPVMELDHILTNRHIRCVRCEHVTSIHSDHRAVVADLEFAP